MFSFLVKAGASIRVFIRTQYTNLALIFVASLIMYTLPTDPDLGWHLKYGEYILTNGAMLRDNIFSHTFTDYYWANSYIFSQAIMSAIDLALGIQYISVFLSVVMASFLVFISEKLLLEKLAKTIFVLSNSVIFLIFTITVRPLFFSTVFMLALLYVLLKRPSMKVFLPFLFALWANFHADFVLGLFVYFIYTLFDLYKFFKQDHFAISSLLKRCFIPVLSVLVTFINPYFYDLHLTLLKETHPLQFQHIGEWRPIYALGQYELVFIVFVLSGIAFLFRKRFVFWHVVLIVAFFLLSLRSQYFARILAVLILFEAPFFLEQEYLKFKPLLKIDEYSVYLKKFFFGLVVVLILSFAYKFHISSNVRLWSEKADFPYGAVSFLNKNNISGPMYNSYSWGGYLIRYLPRHKTFIDGRMPSWRAGDESPFELYISLRENPYENSSVFNEFGFALIQNESRESDSKIVKDNLRLVRYFEEIGWEPAYEDETALIFVNKK